MEDAFDRAQLRDLLQRLGQLLEAGGQSASIVIVGGAALSLLGVVERRTVDIDVIAIGSGPPLRPPERLLVPGALPAAIMTEVARLTRDLGLPEGWINTDVTSGGQLVLAPGFAERVSWERFGGLWVGLTGRLDLIALKLHASVDSDIRSRHFSDLLALRPSAAELDSAAAWVRTQDAGPEFPRLLAQVLGHVRAHTH
jgi:hypothetical protein